MAEYKFQEWKDFPEFTNEHSNQIYIPDTYTITVIDTRPNVTGTVKTRICGVLTEDMTQFRTVIIPLNDTTVLKTLTTTGSNMYSGAVIGLLRLANCSYSVEGTSVIADNNETGTFYFYRIKSDCTITISAVS